MCCVFPRNFHILWHRVVGGHNKVTPNTQANNGAEQIGLRRSSKPQDTPLPPSSPGPSITLGHARAPKPETNKLEDATTHRSLPGPSVTLVHAPVVETNAGKAPAPAPNRTPSTSLQTFPSTKNPLPGGPQPAPLPHTVTPVVKKVVPKPDIASWEHQTIQDVLKVTLDKEVASKSRHGITWLSGLRSKLVSEDAPTDRLNVDLVDRLLVARLELNPQTGTDDLDYLVVLTSLPLITPFQYIVASWKRLNAAKPLLKSTKYSAVNKPQALGKLEKLRKLLISYAGLILQKPEMFPQPPGLPLGTPDLVEWLLILPPLHVLFSPLLARVSTDPYKLDSSEIEQFLQELAREFEGGALESTFGPVVRGLLFHECLSRPEGLAARGDRGWRGITTATLLLVSIKSVAIMITRMKEFNPPEATAATIEKISLMGPICRLGVFGEEWPTIAKYYSRNYREDPSRINTAVSIASLQDTLKILQTSLFQIFDRLVNASPEACEIVLQYFARVVSLNKRRSGTHIDSEPFASDSFMLNLQSVLLWFVRPCIDAGSLRMDEIDLLFYIHSNRIDVSDEARINATRGEAAAWAEAKGNRKETPSPNFISNAFYLCIALSHYGPLKTIMTFNCLLEFLGQSQKSLASLDQDKWRTGPSRQLRLMAAKLVKMGPDSVSSQTIMFQDGLMQRDLLITSVNFFAFVATWLTQQIHPRQGYRYPATPVSSERKIPIAVRILPLYIVEDIVDYFLCSVRIAPEKWEEAGRPELLTSLLPLLPSTWFVERGIPGNLDIKGVIHQSLLSIVSRSRR